MLAMAIWSCCFCMLNLPVLAVASQQALRPPTAQPEQLREPSFHAQGPPPVIIVQPDNQIQAGRKLSMDTSRSAKLEEGALQHASLYPGAQMTDIYWPEAPSTTTGKPPTGHEGDEKALLCGHGVYLMSGNGQELPLSTVQAYCQGVTSGDLAIHFEVGAHCTVDTSIHHVSHSHCITCKV